ncbi:D-3-phosphoglycerate dehydrogenase [Apiospora kogelbergensis]|uniref:D-3-phosphoglycerate dehydrogenase n=1 Tax=Apiospora kogelbergensis TaxID=1337665 RepID=UPI00312F989A
MAPTAIHDERVPTGSPGKPRILVPEKVSPDGLSMLASDFEVDLRPGLSADELLGAISSYHGLIVRSETKVTAKILSAGIKLRVVARAGVGVDNIDVDAATAQGIIVVNSPSGNIVAAAEHTVALLLATARNIGRADRSFKEGKWERSKLVGVEVGHKTLGIIGLGKVGMKVARMCVGLGMKVVAVDPYASADLAKQANVELVASLADLLPIVDFLTIHTPLLASTLDLLGEEEFKRMKKTARVLNVARGGVYNEAALLKALDEGWIAGAGLDVFTQEPPEEGSVAAQLAKHPKVVSTPHLGASTVEAQENAVFPRVPSTHPLILPEEYRKLQPFVKLIEKMGGLYTQHYVGAKGRMLGGRKFELVYQGDLASITNTRPLYAALVKGLVSTISDSGGRDVNIVNANLIAKEKGLVINEMHTHETSDSQTFASLVKLRCIDTEKSGEQIIEGYVSGNTVYISKLGRFTASFTPEGTLLILHNYDEPGKIGGVGTALGKHGINIRFMTVASLDSGEEPAMDSLTRVDSAVAGMERSAPNGKGGNEALMILGVNGVVGKAVVEDLKTAEGILDVSLVQL